MSELTKKGNLGDILSASRIISDSDTRAALEEQKHSGCRFGEALVNLGIVTQEDIDWALSNQLDIPYIHLKKEMIAPEALRLIPADMARTYSFIPLIQADEELNIAIADPLNRPAIEAIERQTGLVVNIAVAMIREIREMIDQCYGTAGNDSLGFDSPTFTAGELASINTDLTGARLLHCLLSFIIQNRLSSLSLQPCGDVVVVSGKQGGTTKAIGTLAPNHYPEFTQRLRKAADTMQSRSLTATGMLSFSYRSRPVSFKVATMQGIGGDYVTIRPHITSQVPSRLAELHLSAPQQANFIRLARTESGITFFASRNPSERCRFMELLLEEGETKGKQVIILGNESGWANKLFPRIPLPRSEEERARLIMDSLDHDPDILVIEDATEGMPFTAACRAAMRGKLVLAGLGIRGTRNALRHLFLYRQSSSFLPVFVNGMVSFKGIQILCPSCRTSYLPPQEEINVMNLESPPTDFFQSTGCEACEQSGFKERRFLLDVLPFDKDLLSFFEGTGDVKEVEGYLSRRGCQGIEQEGLRLLLEGEVSPEEYIAAVVL